MKKVNAKEFKKWLLGQQMGFLFPYGHAKIPCSVCKKMNFLFEAAAEIVDFKTNTPLHGVLYQAELAHLS